MIKFTKAQFHYILYCKGWYDKVCGDAVTALYKLHDKIYASDYGYANRCLINQMIDLIPLESIKRGILDELLDDYGWRNDMSNKMGRKTFEERLAYRVKFQIKFMTVSDSDTALDMVITHEELLNLREGKTFEEFYNALDNYYDKNIHHEENMKKLLTRHDPLTKLTKS